MKHTKLSITSFALWLCIVLIIGSGAAADVPFVFDEKSLDVADYTPSQLEQASSASHDLAGVPTVSSSPNNKVLEFPIVGGGSAPEEKNEKKVDDLKKTVSSRVEPDHFTVHEVALLLVAKFPGDLTIDQICSIYIYMKNGEGSVKGWSYARDPRGSDYFMYANQSLKIGGKASCSGVGDCDDFAILMSALVESIGGTTRIIFAQNKTIGGHAYAEVYLGNLNNQNSQVDEIINWLKQKFNTDKIYTHIDTDSKEVWLNLDWGTDEKGTAHPGGPFYQGDKHIVVCAREFGKTSLKLSATKMDGAELSPAIPLNITTDEIESKSAEVWFNKGFALSSLGKHDEAIKAYDDAIRLNPNDASAWNNKGTALYTQGKYDDAIKAFDEAIRLNPKYADAWNNKGTALCKLSKYDDAVKAYDEAIRLGPNYANAWYNKGLALKDQGKHEDAIKAWDEAIIRLNPPDPSKLAEIWNNKGAVLLLQGKYDDAITCFDKAIRLDPSIVTAWINKGAALKNQGKYDDANKASDEAIRLNPNYAEAWNNKGVALGSQGKYDEAIKCFDEAIRLNPPDPSKLALAWNNKGVALGSQGKYDEAIKCFDEAIRLNPNDALAWNNKGDALKLLGLTVDADAAFAKAKELGYIGPPTEASATKSADQSGLRSPR
jgi:tetratricopeptide (TPR) repeat protein